MHTVYNWRPGVAEGNITTGGEGVGGKSGESDE